MTSLTSILTRKNPSILKVRSYHMSRATNIHSAINRSLRKSNGIAFRGKANPATDDPRKVFIRKYSKPASKLRGPPVRNRFEPRRGKYNKPNEYKDSAREYRGPLRDYGSSPRESRGPPREHRGPREEQRGSSREYGGPPREYRDLPREYGGSPKEYRGLPREYGGPPMDRSAGPRQYKGAFGRDSNPFEKSSRFGASESGKGSHTLDLRNRMAQSLRQTMKEDMDREQNVDLKSNAERSSSFDLRSSVSINSNTITPSLDQFNSQEPERQYLSDIPINRKERRDLMFRTGPEAKAKKLKRQQGLVEKKSSSSRDNHYLSQHNESIKNFDMLDRNVDKNIPISIPYTTPASEFLYGTSVIEAALNSRREPRRKLYKLYIYKGDNRDGSNQDERLQKLAEANGVEVVHVQNNWIRVLDKMSAGRPHNGYILEASPLPRLPVTRLWDVTTRKDSDGNEQPGIEVEVDEQSREEETINGTSNFVRISKPLKKHPLVLLLDGILDPGNLGGIIRTATFFGISAVAISVRNSASFTPVVLKASAGASEIIPLMSVTSPVDFISNSKKAGWKIYAAVAPSENQNVTTNISISSDELAVTESLLDEPTILVVGGEGQGLRRSVRTKADVEVYIPGRQTLGIGSLNVTVASGILCNSFLGEITKKKQFTNLDRKWRNSELETPSETLEVHHTPSDENVQKLEEGILF